jgi:hypothetical protein
VFAADVFTSFKLKALDVLMGYHWPPDNLRRGEIGFKVEIENWFWIRLVVCSVCHSYSRPLQGFV